MAIFKSKKEKTGVIEPIAWKRIIGPHISEKATDLERENRYIFKVYNDANKIEIKKAINELYGIEPVSINIINVSRKKKKLGKYHGWKKGYKKAIIQVKEGDRIDTSPK